MECFEYQVDFAACDAVVYSGQSSGKGVKPVLTYSSLYDCILQLKHPGGVVMCVFRCGRAILAATALGGCSLVPDIPADFALPVREILAQAACELKDTFNSLQRSPYASRFKPKQWLVTVAIAPKADTDLTGGAGWTRKFPYVSNPTTFNSWALTGPGLSLDDKGERSSAINFNFTSGKLMADKTLQCPPATPSAHVLAQHLGVGEWLYRTAAALAVASSASVDKPTYDTDITVKFSGSGSYTFTFPPGTNIASFGGSYSIDEQLNISMAPIADKQTIKIVSLPSWQGEVGSVVSSSPVQAAQSRLDILQLQQAIQSLKSSP